MPRRRPRFTVAATEPPSRIVVVRADGVVIATVSMPEPNGMLATRRYLYNPESAEDDRSHRIASVRIKRGRPITDDDIELTHPDGTRRTDGQH